MPGKEPGLTECRKVVFAVTTLAILIVSLYSNTFHASFHFDDEINIEKRSALHLRELTWPEIKKTFFNQKGNISRPVASFSFAINHYFGGENVFGYHLVNISVHYIASIFLFLLIYQILNLPTFQGKYSHDAYFIALLSAVFWATHPIQTQAVTYIVQRMASMAGMFYIISMYLFLKGRLCSQSYKKYSLYIACFVAGVFSIGSKENAAMLPLSIFLMDLFFIQGISKKNVIRALSVIGLIAVLLPLLAFIIRGSSVLDPEYYAQAYSFRNFTMAQRLLTEPRVLLFYVSLLLYPMPDRLCLSHEIPLSSSLFDPFTTFLSILLIFAALLTAIIVSKKRRIISFCVLFFFLNHIIESTIFPLEIVFEHRNYIPSMFFFLPIALLLRWAISHFSYKRSLQWILTVFVVLVLVAQGHGTFIRNATWRTEESLWIDVIEKYPDLSRGHHNLGNYYEENGQPQKAMEAYQRALELPNPSHGTKRYLIHTNLGSIYSSKGMYDKAILHYKAAMKHHFEGRFFPTPYNNLGVIMLRQGRYTEAAELFVTALNQAPRNVALHHNLGLLFFRTEQVDKAAREFKRALDIDPKHIPSLQYLGIAHKLRGAYGEAAQCFMRVINRRPHAFLVRMHLAETFLLAGNEQRAKDWIEKTLSRTPPGRMLSEWNSASISESLLRETLSVEPLRPYMDAYYGREVLPSFQDGGP